MTFLVDQTAGFAVMVNGWLSFEEKPRKNRTRPRAAVNTCRAGWGKAACPDALAASGGIRIVGWWDP